MIPKVAQMSHWSESDARTLSACCCVPRWHSSNRQAELEGYSDSDTRLDADKAIKWADPRDVLSPNQDIVMSRSLSEEYLLSPFSLSCISTDQATALLKQTVNHRL